MELLLIRHPPVAVAPGICYGAADVPLGADVRAAAERLAPLLPPEFELVSSPASRCRLLAEALASAPHFDPRLAEMDFGAWELRRWDEIGRAEMDAWAADPFGFRPPGGETAHEMSRRALSSFAEWRERAPGALVIVAHSGPLRAIGGTLLGMPYNYWLMLEFRYGCAARFEIDGPRQRLTGFNL